MSSVLASAIPEYLCCSVAYVASVEGFAPRITRCWSSTSTWWYCKKGGIMKWLKEYISEDNTW